MAWTLSLSAFGVLVIVQLGLDFTNKFIYSNAIFIAHTEGTFCGYFPRHHTHCPGKAQAKDKSENERGSV